MLGSYLGGILGIALLCFLLRFVTRRFLRGAALVLVTVTVAFVVGIVLSGFGMANGASPDFTVGIGPYAFGAVIVAVAWQLALMGRASDA